MYRLKFGNKASLFVLRVPDVKKEIDNNSRAAGPPILASAVLLHPSLNIFSNTNIQQNIAVKDLVDKRSRGRA